MKETPILFSTPMVEALLAGTKTQTRRKVKGIALEWLRDFDMTPEYVADPDNMLCPYGKVGDLLWVREAWKILPKFLDRLIYRAGLKQNDYAKGIKWKPSIHLKKIHARIWLEVTNVRIERLHNISQDDSIAEGMYPILEDIHTYYRHYDPKAKYNRTSVASTAFHITWTSINGQESWSANPWVWVVEFKVVSTTGKEYIL